MLVVSRHADERLWAEVLNLGGFDVLTLPFDRDELGRVLSSALRHSPVPMDWALQFAHAFDAACDVIHVAANSDGEEQRRITEDWLTHREREGLDAVKKKLDGGGQLILATGNLASVIAAASVGLKSDLLVMGRSRSRDEIARVHSLPFTLARLAACPVVVT
jgi:nucleotide-binding universal stress UspA family protein